MVKLECGEEEKREEIKGINWMMLRGKKKKKKKKKK